MPGGHIAIQIGVSMSPITPAAPLAYQLFSMRLQSEVAIIVPSVYYYV
jgi:hypothetical protein